MAMTNTKMVFLPVVPTNEMLTAGGHMTDDEGTIARNRALGVYWAMVNAGPKNSEDLLTTLAERFCTAPLPESVCADVCATDANYAFPRSGTNLLTVVEAKEVLRYVLAGVEPVRDDDSEPVAPPPPIVTTPTIPKGTIEFLRDLSNRLFKIATPSMGFDQHDTERLQKLAHVLEGSSDDDVDDAVDDETTDEMYDAAFPWFGSSRFNFDEMYRAIIAARDGEDSPPFTKMPETMDAPMIFNEPYKPNITLTRLIAEVRDGNARRWTDSIHDHLRNYFSLLGMFSGKPVIDDGLRESIEKMHTDTIAARRRWEKIVDDEGMVAIGVSITPGEAQIALGIIDWISKNISDALIAHDKKYV
jgi:hypothetical protein